MSIEAHPSDVGRRVTAKMVQDAQTSGGEITRVLPDGVVYVRWDWQQPQNAPLPTSENLLEWETKPDVDEPDQAEDDSDSILGVASGAVLAEALGGDPGDAEPEAVESEIAGEGGDFGGGGATGDF